MDLRLVSVADAVAAELRSRLLSGDLPGSFELRDTHLAAEFEVARPTVRAAVQMLVADGLLERSRGHSARVHTFDAVDAIDLYRARRPIEVEAVRLVIEGRLPLDAVTTAQRQFDALPEEVDWSQVADADMAFHRSVVAATGSARMVRLFDCLGTELRLLIAQLRPAYRQVRELAQEHARLLGMLQGDVTTKVLPAWIEHLEAGERFFLTLLRERGQ